MNNPKYIISPFRLFSLLRQQKDPKLALQRFQNPNPDPNETLKSKPFRYNNRHYDLIITKLGRAKMFDEMQQVLHQLRNDARIIPEEIVLCNVINFYGRAGLHEQAVQTFDEMPNFRVQRTVKSWNSLLNVLLKCRKYDKMREVFVQMGKHTKPDACSFNILINSCLVKRRLNDAWIVFDEMLRRGLRANTVTFGTLIYGLCLDSRLEEALKLKDDMVKIYNLRPNGHVYASLIKGLCGVGKLSSVFQLKEEMVRSEIGLNSSIYSTLISALFKAGRKEEVANILEEMSKNGCKMDTVTYNTMIKGFCGEMDFGTAFRILDEMEKKGCKADVVSYNVIMSALCKEGKFSEANDLFEDMPRRGCAPDVVSYRILFDGLCDGMRFKEAAMILDEMIFKGYVPRCGSIWKFVDGLHSAGCIELLWTVLDTLVKGNVVDFDTWRIVLSMVCKEDEVCNASKLVQTLVMH